MLKARKEGEVGTTAYGLKPKKVKEISMTYTGIVSTYFPNRKYGFISSQDGTSRFFHASQYCSGSHPPKLGEDVEFELGEPTRLGKDLQAVNIKPIRSASELPADVQESVGGSTL